MLRFSRTLFAATLAVCLFAAVWLALQAPPAAGAAPTAVHHVAPGGDCGGAAPCYALPQTAVSAANPHDTIKLAAGTYTATGSAVLAIDKPLTLLGGYTPADWQTADPAANPTILDAALFPNRVAVTIDAATTATVTLDGLIAARGGDTNRGAVTLVSGALRFVNGEIRHGRGNGLHEESNGNANALYVANSRIHHNDGSGIFVLLGRTRLTVVNSQVTDNGRTGISTTAAGTITIEDSLIQNNAQRGLSLFCDTAVSLHANTIAGNGANAFRGGGIAIGQIATVTLSHNHIYDNRAAEGGGLYVYDSSYFCDPDTAVTLVNNWFYANTAPDGGAAIAASDPYPENGLVSLTGANNVVANSSGADGIRLTGAALDARHWTLSNAGLVGLRVVSGTAVLHNSIVANQTAAGLEGPTLTAHTTLFHANGADCQAGAVCTGSLSGDPAFVNAAAHDFHLTLASAALDQGGDVGVSQDIDGDGRPVHAGYDLGADELAAVPPPQLLLPAAITGTASLTATLAWPAVPIAASFELRWAAAPLDAATWATATLLTDTLPGAATRLTVTVPYSGAPVYFALRYASPYGPSAISNYVIAPRHLALLPLISRP
ncbi:MAG: right-handed parallel beta-helix repeat-containing protein [Anaerolineales bacterium]|nr:right-handed parallel beta-helix repeat-containing protein [Anaerolineales bacterium]